MSADFYQSEAHRELLERVSILHDRIFNAPYAVEYDGIKRPFHSLKAARHFAAMRSRIGVIVTGLFKGRKCLALYQSGKML